MRLFDYEEKHLDALKGNLAECTVLLKSNGDFPLKEGGQIAAYGRGVRNTLKGGTGSGEVNSRFFVTVEEGLTNAGFWITSGAWLDAYDRIYEEAHKKFVEKMKAEARAHHMQAVIYSMGKPMPEPEYDLPLDGEGDVAIYVLTRVSGEGNDRSVVGGDIKLTESEKRDILALNQKYQKFMLVLNVGGPVDLTDVKDVDNILVLSQLGVDTGTALAEILLGRQNPSGKLTTTWSSWNDYSKMGTFGDLDDTYYNEGIYVGYRYFDSVGKKALYPFGFGLSYTTFEQKTDEVSLDGSKVTVKTTVTNTGNRAGKETVQVYISKPWGKLDQPYQDLAGFQKTGLLEPGASETVMVSFDLREVASYHEPESLYLLEKGDYIVRVGNSSVNTEIGAVIRLNEDVKVLQAKKSFGDPGFEDWKPAKPEPEDIPSDVPVLELSQDAISMETVQYDQPSPISENVKQLEDKTLALLNIGAFNPKGGLQSVIGTASQTVAGAAGETARQYSHVGYDPIVMADGPAGLRLTPEYFKDAKGFHAIGQGGMMQDMRDFMAPAALWFMDHVLSKNVEKAPENVEVKYQYCTAIPIGTAIAQSWNTDFAKLCGDIVGDEMERFHVQLWLAPALNIHRSILCGRNFEYYSEDPLISGLMAAAVTEGVQKHPGCGTTIKHFACNNQETNRYGNNSHVSERAIREIYTRGFGICVRKAQPCAVMTSYNLLNGTHTSERRDLIEDLLRSEFGFRGIVMTDWVVLGMRRKEDIYPAPEAKLVAAAGGDLFMPGSKKDYENLLKGLEDGSVSREQLEINGTRVLSMIKKLHP